MSVMTVHGVSTVEPNEPIHFSHTCAHLGWRNPHAVVDGDHRTLSNVFVAQADHFDKVVSYATLAGQLLDPPNSHIRRRLWNWLEYLNNMNGQAVVLYGPDGPLGFSVTCHGWDYTKKAWKFMWNGGLLYYGDGDSGTSGPNFSVRIGDLSEGWSLHT